MTKSAPSKPAKATQEKKARTFLIDCSKPVQDKVLNTSTFAQFLRQRIKVGGKIGKLGDHLKISSDDKNVSVHAQRAFSKRYLKYLTKKYLKKQNLKEFLYVIASSKDNYQIKYFKIQQDAQDDE